MKPTALDLERDLAADLASLERFPGPSAVRGWSVPEHHRAAIRRALAAEARCRLLETELAACRVVCESLAARVAAQGDLLARVAEKEARLDRS